MTLLSVSDLSFSYKKSGRAFPILKRLNFSVEEGDFVAIQGRSGSGKSTLFHILGCLLSPDEGSVVFEGREISRLSEDEKAALRNRRIGFVFQQFHLLPRLSVIENILLGTHYPAETAVQTPADRERARALAKRVGLGEKLNSFPNQLSGGEQQRVAIARALMTDAPLLLADEPTGNLDIATADEIMALLRELNREGRTIVIITHDDVVASKCNKALHLRDGVFEEVFAPVPALGSARPEPPSLSASYWRLLGKVFPLAWESLGQNKRRAALTMIGIVVGIASVFAMVTFGEYTKRRILEGYQELGANSVIIRGHNNWFRQATDKVDVIFHAFDWEKDVLPLQRVFPALESLSPVLDSWGNTGHYGGQSTSGESMVLGVSSDYLNVMGRQIAQGRAFTPYHIGNRSAVCIIGSDVAARLFRQVSPVGRILFVTTQGGRSYPCEVIGTLVPLISNKEMMKPNLNILVPYTYFQSLHESWESEIDRFVAKLSAGEDVERVGKAITAFFKRKYGSSGRFSVDADVLLLAQMKKFLSLFSMLLTTIALVTLSVGGIGITNMMLVSVSERIKEIGLRKALGATNRSVRMQLLLESTLLCFIAGTIGVGLGFSAYELIIYLASRVVSRISFEWVLEPSALVISLLAIAVVGIVSGIAPALRAERLQVIEALRSE